MEPHPPRELEVPGIPVYRKHGLRIAESWLDEPVPRPGGVDVVLLRQYSSLPAGAIASPFHSLVHDLTFPEERLLAAIDSSTRYEVRRAQNKDGVECIQETAATATTAAEFRNFFDQFASGKGLPGIREAEFAAQFDTGRLRLSRAVYRGETVVWHGHILTPERATLLYSASLFRSSEDNEIRAAIGRANKLLHWADMLAFRSEGRRVYDFGGWYAGTEDRALLSINLFKERFGGSRVDQVHGVLPLTWRGWLYAHALEALPEARRKRLAAWLRRARRH